MIFIFAQPPLLPSIKKLLVQCELFADDLDAEKVKHLLLCRTEGQLAGVVGMEVFGETGLLRSLAVAPEFRGRGIGALLLVRIERFAALQGVRNFFVTPSGAEDFLTARGYLPADQARLALMPADHVLVAHQLSRGAPCLVKALRANKVPAARRAGASHAP